MTTPVASIAKAQIRRIREDVPSECQADAIQGYIKEIDFELAVAANGGTGLAKSATGKTFILGDIHPLALLAFDSTANSVATQINFQTDISDGAYARYQYAWCLGRDGVIYVTGIDDDAGGPKYLYASADDGASWQVLSFNAPGKTPGGESLWASGPSGRLFIGEGSWRYTSVPDYTRAQLKRRFSV